MNVLLMCIMNDYINKNIVKDIEIEYIEDINGKLVYSKNVEKKKKENEYIDYKQKSIEYLNKIAVVRGLPWWFAENTYKEIIGNKKSGKEAYYYILQNYSNNVGW